MGNYFVCECVCVVFAPKFSVNKLTFINCLTE